MLRLHIYCTSMTEMCKYRKGCPCLSVCHPSILGTCGMTLNFKETFKCWLIKVEQAQKKKKTWQFGLTAE